MEIFDAAPRVEVDPIEYTRLLGFPRGHVLEGRVLELSSWARDWYAVNGRPWVYARASRDFALEGDCVRVDDVRFTSPRWRGMLDRAGAHGVMLVAVSAGPEIEQQAHRAWLQEKPDEYFFLEMYGSAVVEHLTTMTGARLCAWADGESIAVLPHYSPGYPDWEISEQQALHALIGADALPGALDVFESGMLRPKKSLLAVFGITRHVDRVQRLSDLVPCENCSYAGCQFRRVPYGRTAVRGGAPRRGEATGTAPVYTTSTKALKRWADERLTLQTCADGTVNALFQYEGTTCSNMGRRLAFDYRVVLGPRDEGYRIQSQSCTPADADDGYASMCEYLREGDALIEQIARDTPLAGRPLNEVLSWKRPAIGPGCYCEKDARLHKWGLVLETIHFALMNGSG
jgi:hypothetical protein